MAQLVSVQRTATDGRLFARFEGVWHGGEPTPEQISDAQRQAGYAPEGYGGPYRAERVGPEHGEFVTMKWESSGSCD